MSPVLAISVSIQKKFLAAEFSASGFNVFIQFLGEQRLTSDHEIFHRETALEVHRISFQLRKEVTYQSPLIAFNCRLLIQMWLRLRPALIALVGIIKVLILSMQLLIDLFKSCSIKLISIGNIKADANIQIKNLRTCSWKFWMLAYQNTILIFVHQLPNWHWAQARDLIIGNILTSNFLIVKCLRRHLIVLI